MKYVNLNATINGIEGVLDPSEYLQQLHTFGALLPVGARTFAMAAEHYDFYSQRCTKDLALERIRFGEEGEERWMELGFRHNCWKHEEDLTIRYLGVSAYALDMSEAAGRPDVVILDEILPHPRGCTHEIALRPGTIMVTCRDLTATWTEADCPDKS
ncbi:hypothetical protein GCM10023194_68010 [Planotetraspora phitsanulokensis]|uniref:Uncharacterized protein n=1 Tax=Planotetraspora phitsanulokensis TaxID=575192 RepID=A0A8J3XH46_9ACTN|nr:hypothetical protein [Planotetraspora phitsanulokensis]GII39636.1 hypothetical protein Pph01_46390 [Planotetraspora phitsanulokensis]